MQPNIIYWKAIRLLMTMPMKAGHCYTMANDKFPLWSGIFEFVDKQISLFDSAVRNVDFMAYFTR